MAEVDRNQIILQYGSRRLPRYTSYPTAPHFSAEIDAAEYAEWLSEVSRHALGSLYLHVPYCRSMCWYCGCHTRATRQAAPVERYLDALEREIDCVAATMPHRMRVGHVHWGGGSPTLVPPARFAVLMRRLRERFDMSADAEVAVEVDPRTLDNAFIDAMAENGVTRVSLGVQTFDPLVQAAISRAQSWGMTRDTVRRLRAAGIADLSLDLLYGLPRQTAESCRDTALRARDLVPSRVSAFGYAHMPHLKPHQRMIREEELPDLAARLAQADAIAEILQTAGYLAIGLDHFARADDVLAGAWRTGTLRRNFQGYTADQAEVLLGFGASAIGRLPQGYVQNETATGLWESRARAGQLVTARGLRLMPEDRMRAAIIEQLMCFLRADVADIAAAYGLPEPEAELSVLERYGVVRRKRSCVEVSTEYRPLLRAVAAAYDTRLGPTGARHAFAV